MSQAFAEFLDGFDALECFSSTLETLLAFDGICRDCWAEAVDRGQGGEVFEFEALPMHQNIHSLLD